MDVFAVLLILSVIMYTSGVFTWNATLAFARVLDCYGCGPGVRDKVHGHCGGESY